MECKNNFQEQLDGIASKAAEEEKKRKFSTRHYRRLTNEKVIHQCHCCGAYAQVIGVNNGQIEHERYIVSCRLCGKHTTEKTTINAARYEWELMQKLQERIENEKARMLEEELAEEEEAEEKKQKERAGKELGLGFSLSI